MGLIEPFIKVEHAKNNATKSMTSQPGRWDIINHKDGARLCLRAYSSGSINCKGGSPQVMVFEPKHIEEFEEILKQWRERQDNDKKHEERGAF